MGEIQKGLSRNGHDKNFAPKQNERDCPMTHIVEGQSEISSKEVK